MNFKPIIIVAGEPNSVFLEILIKSIKNKINSPIILIISEKIFKLQMKKLKFFYPYISINQDDILNKNFDNKKINLLNVNYGGKKAFEKISNKSQKYINACFELGLNLVESGITDKFINGPISKKKFLRNKYLGVTELLAKITATKKYAMLLYNKELAVSPITTHLPIKLVTLNITKKMIIEKVNLLFKFYKDKFNKNPRIAVLGINPHCESIEAFDEDKNIIEPAVKYLKKTMNITGPIPADTAFIKQNRKKFDLIIGMYHDQVLTPIKTLYEYKLINITVGLPFIRVSPDHGPNEKMMGKNLSNPQSLVEALKFLDF